MGVDSEPAAVATATRNAARLKLPTAQFLSLTAAELARFLSAARYRPDVVILDPPRTGARSLIEPLARMRPRQVIYVSCDVATFARDLRALRERGYEVSAIHGFDFFPNTHHAEVVAHAVLTSARGRS